MTGMGAISALSRRLSDNAEAVCRAYLPGGRRSGRYWIAGDVSGVRGRSLFVRLSGDGSGKWAEYVAVGIMLRFRRWGVFCGQLLASTQHNGSKLREGA
jgi:hypothetical protein